MNLHAIFSAPVFSQLLPEQVALFRRFASDIQGKSSAEIARLYQQLNQQVNKIRPITGDQRKQIMQAVNNQLSPEDKKKLGVFAKIFLR